MKKHLKNQNDQTIIPAGPSISDLINKMQQQLNELANKIDLLISKSSSRPPEPKPFSKPFQQQLGHSHQEMRKDNNYRERILYKAICADCKKDCELPFKPNGERPVYCKDCFSKRKASNSFKPSHDNRPKEVIPAPVIPTVKGPAVEKKKAVGKKKPAAKKRKAR